MAKTRSYKLLCPIARALDRIGDRWTLLILRDLMAGPARFSELQRGLTGIAANLLTERLAKLVEDGLAVKAEGGHGTSVYRLTEAGRQASDVVFELARFGARFQPGADVVAPGNLRTVAATMGLAAQRVVLPDMAFSAGFLVDGEEMHLQVRGGHVDMTYGPGPEPDLVFSTGYEDLLAVTEGEITLEDFAATRSTLTVETPGKEQEFLQLMALVVENLAEG